MTVMLSITRQAPARCGLAVFLLGAGLLIASMQASSAGEITPTLVSASPSQAQDVRQSDPELAPTANMSRQDLGPISMVGLGWG